MGINNEESVHHTKEFGQHNHVQSGLRFEHAVINIFFPSVENSKDLMILCIYLDTNDPFEKATYEEECNSLSPIVVLFNIFTQGHLVRFH